MQLYGVYSRFGEFSYFIFISQNKEHPITLVTKIGAHPPYSSDENRGTPPPKSNELGTPPVDFHTPYALLVNSP